MKTLVIKVKRWLHGGRSPSQLRNKAGSMCCLGFLARDCGASVKDIEEKSTPGNTTGIGIKWPQKILRKAGHYSYDFTELNTTLSHEIMRVNDNKNLPLAEKQSELKKLFLQIGYRLTFK